MVLLKCLCVCVCMRARVCVWIDTCTSGKKIHTPNLLLVIEQVSKAINTVPICGQKLLSFIYLKRIPDRILNSTYDCAFNTENMPVLHNEEKIHLNNWKILMLMRMF